MVQYLKIFKFQSKVLKLRNRRIGTDKSEQKVAQLMKVHEIHKLANIFVIFMFY
jgi:hypothetical protein